MEFSPIAVHLLASGGADGELIIWDISNPASPTEYNASAVSQRHSLTKAPPAVLISCIMLLEAAVMPFGMRRNMPFWSVRLVSTRSTVIEYKNLI